MAGGISLSVSRNIQKGLTEIIRAAKFFAKGLYSTRARVFSHDELGVVANSFNRMSDELEWCIVDLEQAQRKFKLLLECAPDAIIITDKNGIMKLVNAQTEKRFEYKRNDLLERPFEMLIPERLREPPARLMPLLPARSASCRWRAEDGLQWPVRHHM